MIVRGMFSEMLDMVARQTVAHWVKAAGTCTVNGAARAHGRVVGRLAVLQQQQQQQQQQ